MARTDIHSHNLLKRYLPSNLILETSRRSELHTVHNDFQNVSQKISVLENQLSNKRKASISARKTYWGGVEQEEPIVITEFTDMS